MGTPILYIQGQVRRPEGKQADAESLVDSGATYSVLPKEVWEQLGLKPKRKMQFTLADGTAIERSISGCRSRISFSVAARERLLVGNGR